MKITLLVVILVLAGCVRPAFKTHRESVCGGMALAQSRGDYQQYQALKTKARTFKYEGEACEQEGRFYLTRRKRQSKQHEAYQKSLDKQNARLEREYEAMIGRGSVFNPMIIKPKY